MSKPVREYLGPILSILGVVNLALSILNGFRQLLGPHLKWVFMLASVAWAVWLWLERKPALLTGAPRQPFYPKWLRIGGTVAAVLVAVASFVPSARRWWENQRPANKVIVVLARFYDPNGMNVQDDLARGIKAGIDSFQKDARFVSVDTVFREGADSADVAKYGRRYKATILIWGSCDRSDTDGRVITHFEVLRPPAYMPELSAVARGQPRYSTDMAGLGTFVFSTRVGDEMAATCLMTLGMVHYSAGDYAGAVRPLVAALKSGGEGILDPQGAAATWFYLGNAYRALADSVNVLANCRRAIASYGFALAIFTLANFPEDFAMTQDNLGSAYWTLAEVEDKADNCRRAIAACQEALKVRTFERSPNKYAMVQNNLGTTYVTLAWVDDMADNCRRAIVACQEALKVRTPERLPMDYAVTQNNLGNAYVTLAVVDNKADNCRQAIAAFEKALKIKALDRTPTAYAMTQNNLGVAYSTLADVEDTAGNCRRAIAACRKALRVYKLKGLPTQCATALNNLGIAYGILAEVEDKPENCRRAIAACQEALKDRTLERFPIDYAATQNNLGSAYSTLAKAEDTTENCRRAIAAFQEALKVRTPERLPMDYAATQNNLGDAYSTLAKTEDTAENCRRAIAAYHEALKVFTLDKLPSLHGLVVQSLTQLRSWMKEHGMDSAGRRGNPPPDYRWAVGDGNRFRFTRIAQPLPVFLA
jgi:tetratricopeptide (TPR) repeat protein